MQWNASGIQDELSSEKREYSSFDTLKLSKPVCKALGGLGYTEPSWIQKESIPQVLAGKDLLASAETGSGKTAAFLAPIVERLYRTGGELRGKALVLEPTRELAGQCYSMLMAIKQYTIVTSNLIVGGNSEKAEIADLGAIVVATPGKLINHILNTPNFSLTSCEILVLDECDRLLDMGFRYACVKIVAHVNMVSRVQTLLFSATITPEVQALASLAIKDAVVIKQTEIAAVPETIRKEFIPVSEDIKLEAALLAYMRGDGFPKNAKGIIIFGTTRESTSQCSRVLAALGYSVSLLHGKLSQKERIEALEKFQKREAKILVATDLAARGLDISHVDVVINFELPVEKEVWVHRCGRTGRAGSSGLAVTFFRDPGQGLKARQLAKLGGKSTSIQRNLDMDRVKIAIRDIKNAKPDIRRLEEVSTIESQMRAISAVQEKISRPSSEWLETREKAKKSRSELSQLARSKALSQSYYSTDGKALVTAQTMTRGTRGKLTNAEKTKLKNLQTPAGLRIAKKNIKQNRMTAKAYSDL